MSFLSSVLGHVKNIEVYLRAVLVGMAHWLRRLRLEVSFPAPVLSYSLGSSDIVLLNSPSPGPDKGLFPKGARSQQHGN